jgi:hypothetical protein
MRSVHGFTVPPAGALGVTIFLGEDWDKRKPLEKRLSIHYREDGDGSPTGAHLQVRQQTRAGESATLRVMPYSSWPSDRRWLTATRGAGLMSPCNLR